jgi:hypothetical protein
VVLVIERTVRSVKVKVKVTVVDITMLIQMLIEGDPIESLLKLVCSIITGLALMILITRIQKHAGVTFAMTVGMPGTSQGIAPTIDTPRKRI